MKLHIDEKEIITHDRKILNGVELDIYIPSKNLAFEFDGIIWHSELIGNKSKYYHIEKTERCEQNHIQLIHILEHEWANKQYCVKRKILHLLKISSLTKKIYARECLISEISPFEKNQFLNTYHLQGEDRSSIHIGAYYDNELVSVMTFGPLRIALGSQTHKPGEYEMHRFCLYKPITGIATKMFSYFKKKFDPKKVITFADRRFSNINDFYTKLGFNFVGYTKPNYWYFKPNNALVLYHRFNFRKDQLPKKLKVFDDSLTEWENMQLNGYDRIWDCGNLKFVWEKYEKTN